MSRDGSRSELFRLARQDRCTVGLIVTLAVAGAVTACWQMSNLSQVLAAVVVERTDIQQLQNPLLWLLGALIARAAILGGSELVGQRLAASVKQRLRYQLVRSILSRGPLLTQKEKTGEIATCCGEGVEKLDAWFSRYLPHALMLACVPPILILYTATLDWLSALVFALTAPLIVVFMVLIGLTAQQRTAHQWNALSQMGGYFLDVLQGLPTLHLLGRSGVQGARIRQVSEDFRRTTLEVLKVAFLSGLVLELAASLSTALVAVEVGVRLVGGQISFYRGMLVLLLAPEFYFSFRQFGASHHAGMEGAAAAERIFGLLKTPASARLAGAEQRSAENEPAAASKDTLAAKIPFDRWPPATGQRKSDGAPPFRLRFERVSSRYPGCESFALTDVSFELRSGRTHLFVGESGAGKSTVFKLLLRFIDPTYGRITVNDVPLEQFTAESWRKQIAAAVQQPHFFAGTVFDNIRAGKADATLAEVREAARLAEADTFICALPSGYDTPMTEAANRFSGGERQRLAVARALVRDCPVLFLDEPTSYLDQRTAARLLANLRRLSSDRIVVLIAHQADASASADVVFRLAQGRLVSTAGSSPAGQPTSRPSQDVSDPVLAAL